MPKSGKTVLTIDFEENKHAFAVFGDLNRNLNDIEKALQVHIHNIGNHVEISGDIHNVNLGHKLLLSLYQKAKKNGYIKHQDIKESLRLLEHNQDLSISDVDSASEHTSNQVITRKNLIKPRTHNQGLYIQALKKHDMVFGLGPAGTGKTYLAVAVAVNHFLSGKVKKIILTRPAVEAGENLGFLPGDLKQKVDPYLRPLFDALTDMLPIDLFEKMMESEQIEVAPLAFMRGRTLSNAFVILDEAQNTTQTQMKMFLTRLGEGSKMAINGDTSQIDLPHKTPSGLVQATAYLKNVDTIGFVEFTDDDVVRHPLVSQIIKAYNKQGESFSC